MFQRRIAPLLPLLFLVLALFSASGPALGQTSIEFTDYNGQPLAQARQSDYLYLRVTDSASAGLGSLPVEISSDIRGDHLTGPLQESPAGSGVFLGSVFLYPKRMSDPSSGFGLTVTEDPGPPHRYDTVRVTLTCQAPPCPQASIPTYASSLRFLDNQGNPLSLIPIGNTFIVEGRDSFGSPFPVTLTAQPGGDTETVFLQYAGGYPADPYFHTTVPTTAGPAVPGDGQLQLDEGGTLVASHLNYLGSTTAISGLTGSESLQFLDRWGNPTDHAFTFGLVRLRAISAAANLNPNAPDLLTVTVRAVDVNGNTRDSEDVQLQETGPSTSLFTGQIRSQMYPQPAANGLLDTWTTWVTSSYQNDRIEASFGNQTVTAALIPSIVRIIDAAGNDIDSVAAGDTVHVQIETDEYNTSPTRPEFLGLRVFSLTTGDQEDFHVFETGPDTSTFEGSFQTAPETASTPGNRMVELQPGETLSVEGWSYYGIVTDTAQVLGGGGPVNHPPDVVPDEARTAPDTPVTINVTANDSDPDGDTLTAYLFSQPWGGGTLTQTGPGTLLYTPPPGVSVVDSFIYRVIDSRGAEGFTYVSVFVANNRPPAAVDDALTTAEDTASNVNVLANDNDPDGNILSVVAVTQPAHGSATFTASAVTYTPAADYNGSDSLTYTVSDGQGGTATATVNVTVTPVNDLPVARDDAFTLSEDFGQRLDPLANDSDAEGPVFLVMDNLEHHSAHGTYFFYPDGFGKIDYQPNADFNGTDTFTYSITDGTHQATATVTVTVTPVNDPPIGTSDRFTTLEDTPLTFAVLPNDTDVDGDALSVSRITQPAHGTAVLNANGTVTYAPAANYNGADFFNYYAADGAGAESFPTRVDLTVTAVQDPPVARDDVLTVQEDTPTNLNVTLNDSDPDNDFVAVQSVTQPAHGTVTLSGSLVYTSALNYNGPDAFTYTVSDGHGNTATASVSLTVTPVNDRPVAVQDNPTTLEDTPVTIAVLANDSDVEGDTLTITGFTQGLHGVATLNADGTVTYTPALNYNGIDTFVYNLSDGHGGTASGLVRVTLTPVNDPPVANANSATTNEDTAVAINVTANDSDVDGDSLSVQSVTPPAYGTATFTGGTITYTPAADFNGSDSFTYTVSDGHGGTATAAVSVTVNAVNDPPRAVDDTVTTPEDTSIQISVMSNDTDDGITQILSVGTPAHGTALRNGFTGTITYTPSANYYGPDSFTYTIQDLGNLTGTATVYVTVTSVNDLPVAISDAASTAEDTPVTINVLANDSDPEGDALSVAGATQGLHGSTQVNADNTITYTPALNYYNSDSFTYTLRDANGGTRTGTVNVTISPVNDPPVAVDDTAVTAEDTAKTISVRTNDSDPELDSLTVTGVTQPAHGTATFTTVSVTYTPAANYNGADAFTYTISDGKGGTASATVSITVTPVNDAPAAGGDTATTAEDTAAAFDVLANDTDPDGDSLAVTAVTQPAHGSATFTASGVTYTPAINYNGADSFTYTVSDGNGGSATGTVSVTVTLVNDAPSAGADAATTNEDTAKTIPVLTNDSDPDGDSLTVTAVTQPAHGSTAFTSSGVTYTPTANYNGADSFTYTVSDGNGGSATGTVNVTVTPVNDAPSATADSATTNEDAPVTVSVLTNDSDPEGDTLTVTAVTQPAHGSATFTASGVTYTPAANYNGADSFTYTISDGNGGSATGTVNLAVTAVNDAPSAGADTATTAEDTAKSISVLTNDSDPDGDSLAVTAVTQPAHGSTTFTSSGVSYTPAANYNGSDSFTYTISDGNGGSATGTVNVTVTPVNDAPSATADSATTNEDAPVTVSVLTNDSDPEGDTLAVTAVTQPAHGSTTFTASGVTYTPAANYNGADSFTYTISDGNGGNATGTVSVTITAINDAPSAGADSATTAEDTAKSISVLTNDSDPDGDTLAVTAVTQPAHGSATFTASGVTYTPAANYNGADTFTYTISDGHGGTATGTVSISVTAVNDPPAAINDSGTTREGVAVAISVLTNDSDLEGNPLTVTGVSTPAHGAASFNSSSVTYTPAANFNGIDTFTYTVSDGAATNTATVTITVKDALERVAVLATNSAWIQTGADVLSGDVVVNQAGSGPFLNGAELSLAGTVTTPSGWDLDADSLTIAAGTTVASDVFFNQLTNSGTITGQQTATLPLPVFASLPAFLTATPNTTDVNVGANGNRTLAPGSYRDLIVGKKGTVIFSGGTYHFRSISADTQAKLLFSAASTVRVQQKMSVKATSTVGPNTGATINASAIVVYVEGINGTGGGLAETPKAVEIGTDTTLTANLYAPNGTLWIADRTQARGSFIGKDVQIGPDVQVTLQTAWSGQ
jgi:hypothetical protein